MIKKILIPLGLLSVSCLQAQQKHNYLILLTDDQSFNTLSISGNTETETPNMDHLISEGTYFSQAHVMGGMNGAISQPSRAMLLTGMGLMDVKYNGSHIPESDITFPELFRQHGYCTFETGKWHSDAASFNRSFTTGANIFFGGMHAPGPDGKLGHVRPFLHQYNEEGIYNKSNGKYVAEKAHTFSSELYANAAIDFLKSRENDDQPFLMYVAFTSPHDPRNVIPDYGRKFGKEEVSLPGNFLTQHPFDTGDLDVRDEKLLPSPRDPELVRQERAYYYSMVNEVDVQIGRILDALEKSGKKDNTIIIFAADNGLAVGEHGLLGKQNLYEASVRVPLSICGPGLPKGKQKDALLYLYDIYPTICDLEGFETPSTVTGKSFLKVLEGKQKNVRKDLLLAYMNLQRAIKTDRYKLILYNVNGERNPQLFDLKKDPLEKTNLYYNPAYAKVREKLTAELYVRMRACGDFCDPSKSDWGYPFKINSADVKAITERKFE